MAAPAILTTGTTITYNSQTINGHTSFTAIGSGERTEHDVTSMADTEKRVKMGLRDNGRFDINLIRNQDDLGQLELWNALSSATPYSMVITLPTSTANVLTFNAFVVSVTTDGSEGPDGVVRGTATIRIDGGITFS